MICKKKYLIIFVVFILAGKNADRYCLSAGFNCWIPYHSVSVPAEKGLQKTIIIELQMAEDIRIMKPVNWGLLQ